MELIAIQMDQNMKDIGLKINNKGRERNHGMMELVMKENINKGKNVEKENLLGRMDHYL